MQQWLHDIMNVRSGCFFLPQCDESGVRTNLLRLAYDGWCFAGFRSKTFQPDIPGETRLYTKRESEGGKLDESQKHHTKSLEQKSKTNRGRAESGDS